MQLYTQDNHIWISFFVLNAAADDDVDLLRFGIEIYTLYTHPPKISHQNEEIMRRRAFFLSRERFYEVEVFQPY